MPGDVAVAVIRLSGPAVIGILLAVLGAIVLLRDPERRRVGASISIWAGLPIVLALLGLLVKPVFLDRYVILTAPAFALLAAAALRRSAIGPRSSWPESPSSCRHWPCSRSGTTDAGSRTGVAPSR